MLIDFWHPARVPKLVSRHPKWMPEHRDVCRGIPNGCHSTKIHVEASYECECPHSCRGIRNGCQTVTSGHPRWMPVVWSCSIADRDISHKIILYGLAERSLRHHAIDSHCLCSSVHQSHCWNSAIRFLPVHRLTLPESTGSPQGTQS